MVRSGRESVIISAGAALVLPAVVCVVLPLNLFAANAEELSGLAGLGLMAAAAFIVSTLVFWPAFLIGLRSRGWSSVPLAVMTLALCILLWRLTAAVGEHFGAAWVQALLDLAAASAALFIVARMSLRNLYVTAGVVSICLLVSSAVSHGALVISHAAYFLDALPAELGLSAATSGAAASTGSAPLPGANVPEKSLTEPAPGFTGNVYHLVLDGFQGDAYEKIAADRPDMLPGFTYFPNFVSNAGRTVWSNGMLIRGAPLSELGDESPIEWEQRAYSDGLWADLRRNGVAVHQYPHYDYYCFAGAVVCKSSVQLLRTVGRDIFVDLWFLNLLPRSANRLLAAAAGKGGEADPAADGAKDDWSYGFSVTRYLAGISGIDPRDIPAFSMQLFEEMLDDEASRPPSGQYVFVHLIVPHGPYVLDEDCSYVPDVPVPGGAYRAVFRQHKCAVHVIERLAERLEELGRLDTSLIIVHSDHGAVWHPIELDKLLDRPASPSTVRRVAVDEEDSALWPSDVIEARGSALLLTRMPGEALGRTAPKVVQTIDLAPTILRAFGLPTESYAGLAVQDASSGVDRPVVFFANNVQPDRNWPAVFSEYRCQNGRWLFYRNIKTGN